MADNAERLLSEALRAQAVTGGAPTPAGRPQPASGPGAAPATAAGTAPAGEEPSATGLPARWVLLFAVLLGLAVGTVAGFISVL
ncbi:hypothetical protein [Streptoalloteichus hindustanus]|uniref:Uncharacterized protein n=1 Tax=Streptoalloteichus hindustanus TaxID=2017 RepID=A0A1M4UH06_STRHI|nr:hypothetical protein [Streptoalloteichus hindustanus]SHE55954.1 hypothetical protein SAMN05444320_101420 [Streptoalloteichus hindustanus]